MLRTMVRMAPGLSDWLEIFQVSQMSSWHIAQTAPKSSGNVTILLPRPIASYIPLNRYGIWGEFFIPRLANSSPPSRVELNRSAVGWAVHQFTPAFPAIVFG